RRSALFRASWTAVFIEEIIDPGAGALERPVRRRDIDLQQLEFIRRFRAFVHLHPNASLFRNHFALTVVGAAARPISKLLGTCLRADILHVRYHTVAAFLTSERR